MDGVRCTVYGDIVRTSVIIAGVRVRVCVSVHALVHVQHGNGHAAWTSICSIDMDIQHGHGAWTSTCSIDRDMQHGHGSGHAAWTRTRNMDLDMQHELQMQLGHGLGQLPGGSTKSF